MGIDRPDDADVPSGNPRDRPFAADNDGQQSGASQAETRYRDEYYSARTQVAQEERATTGSRQRTPASDTWTETANLARWMWGEYHRRWPPEERPPADRSGDPPGSWRGDSGRFLASTVNAELEQECDQIADRERETVSPRLREVESCDPRRHLIGFDDRLKGRDRMKEKIAKSMDEKNLSPKEAVSLLPDAIRYTFQYDQACYTESVQADILRMKEQGFKLDILRNSWSTDQYKGVNSQWIDPESGQRLELQFHTRISFEAKQITHSSYERLRTLQTDPFEQMVLEAFQRKVAEAIPIPAGATDIPDYPERLQDAG